MNISVEDKTYLELLIAYDVESLFSANPSLTERGVNESTVDVWLRQWNDGQWIGTENQTVDKVDKIVYNALILRNFAQYSLFFSYPEMFGVFQLPQDHICLNYGTSYINVQVLRRFGFIADVSVSWKAEIIHGFKTHSVATGTLHFRQEEKFSYIRLTVEPLAKSFGRIVVSLVTAFNGALIDPERRVIPVTLLTESVNGLVEFENWAPSLLVPEDVGVINLPIKRHCYKTVISPKPVLIQLKISWLSSQATDAFLPVSKLVTIGDSTVNAQLDIINDTVPELDEKVAISLVNVRNAVAGTNTQAIVTVVANDDPHGVVELDSVKGEVREEDARALITVRRNSGLFGSIEVIWTAINRTAVGPESGEDWDFDMGSSGVLLFTENQSVAVIQIRINSDSLPELDEDFEIRLVSANNGSRLGDNLTQTITIHPTNDHAPSFANKIISQTVDENKVFKKTHQLIWTASANDPDLGDNGRLAYGMTDGNCSYMSLNESTGDAYLLSPVAATRENRLCFMEIIAMDRGLMPLSDTVVLYVHLAFTFRCPPGSYSVTGSMPCQDCPRHTYQPYFGLTRCINCPNRLHTALDGETDVAACKGKNTSAVKTLPCKDSISCNLECCIRTVFYWYIFHVLWFKTVQAMS